METYIFRFIVFFVVVASMAQSEIFDVTEDEMIVKNCAGNSSLANPEIEIWDGVAKHKITEMSLDHKCMLLCILKKKQFLDEEANLANKRKLISKTIQKVQLPSEITARAVILGQLIQIVGQSKGIENKCQRGYFLYVSHLQNMYSLQLAKNLINPIFEEIAMKLIEQNEVL